MSVAPDTLHDALPPSWRRASRWLLIGLLVAVAALAFDPHPPEGIDTGWDKLNHLLAFAVLGTLAWLTQAPGRWQALRAGAGLLLYGAFIEVVQTQIPGRSGEVGDLLADAMGIALGIGIAVGLLRLRRRLR